MPEIDGDVENLSAQTAYEFIFSVWRQLKVHSSHSTASRSKCVIYLCNRQSKPGERQFLRTEEAAEETPNVLRALTLHQNQIIQRCWMQLKLAHSGCSDRGDWCDAICAKLK